MYCIVENNLITNIVEATPENAKAFGFLLLPEGKGIGDIYKEDESSKTVNLLNSQIKALSSREELLEECIIEIAQHSL